MKNQVVGQIAAGLVLWAAVSPGLCAPATGVEPGATQSMKVAMDAYQLRVKGKVDDARVLLEKAIQDNPRNAAAHYELARIRVHMALGDMKGGMKGALERIGEAQQSIARAKENDPDNVIYPAFEGGLALLQAYPAWMQNQPDTKEKMGRVCGAFESALKLKPDYRQVMLSLVELYGTLPADKGGDKSKAERYAAQLEKLDAVYGAKARSILLGEANNVDYWQSVLKKHEGNADVLEELGKAYLRDNKVDDAVACFERAIKINPEKSLLFLDLSIHYTWLAMRAERGSESFRQAVASGEAAVTRYLDTRPVLPMRAYALGVQYKYLSHSGRKEQADMLLKQAVALDPYFSKATGAPNPDLFTPPDEISHNHRYLFRPIQ